ncbi:unnamed protein product [Amoebophrya sp. A120]|nr:unnamed protein product [Amoebophrya sp. A120]|eukprot:GSA120T00025916001.1
MAAASSSSTAVDSSGPSNPLPQDPDNPRYPHRQQIEKFVADSFKEFVKAKCGHCGNRATKRFAKSMSFVVTSMVESFWCPDCGRILCENCRYSNHNCEKVELEMEKRKNLTPEEIKADLEKKALEEQIREQAKLDEEYAEKEKLAQGVQQRKFRRKIYAQKAKMVEDFLQQFLRTNVAQNSSVGGPVPGMTGNTGQGGGGFGGSGGGATIPSVVRKELMDDLFPKSKTLSLQLYNDYEHPASNELLKEEWKEVQRIYARTVELTGMRLRDPESGGPLEMTHSWEEEGGGGEG